MIPAPAGMCAQLSRCVTCAARSAGTRTVRHAPHFIQLAPRVTTACTQYRYWYCTHNNERTDRWCYVSPFSTKSVDEILCKSNSIEEPHRCGISIFLSEHHSPHSLTTPLYYSQVPVPVLHINQDQDRHQSQVVTKEDLLLLRIILQQEPPLSHKNTQTNKKTILH